jgi:hypothetical protein
MKIATFNINKRPANLLDWLPPQGLTQPSPDA